MAFDINEVLAQMLGSIKTTTKDSWNNVKDSAGTYFQNRKSRLDLLASLLLQKEISKEFFLKRVADEKTMLESELHSIAIITKAIAQKAANAAIDIFQNA
ncbi:MAG: hypothetical protein ABI834_00615, partial [Ginsengibacter sp.]